MIVEYKAWVVDIIAGLNLKPKAMVNHTIATASKTFQRVKETQT